ncbi:hypothetical protein Q7689_00945 [Nocardiopsis tropica]|uniref:hypothetical protein n=1 Tax=Nocardiopsis tropica TaxID=109330 RepID=UPI002E8A104E|nr:hypothetical protein [Nocardiopsis tropica]
MTATTAVTITDLTASDIRLVHEAAGAGPVNSLAIAGCYIDLTPEWMRPHQRAERIAALETLARAAFTAAEALRKADEEMRR